MSFQVSTLLRPLTASFVAISLITVLLGLTPKEALAQTGPEAGRSLPNQANPFTKFPEANPDIAKCGELQSEGAKFQMDMCSAHLGCRMVLSIHNTCAKAERFINNLTQAIGEGVKTLFGTRKELTSDHVFEASLNTKQRAVERDPSWREKIEPIREATKQVKENVKATASGSSVYVGNLDDTGRLQGDGYEYLKLPYALMIRRYVGRDNTYSNSRTSRMDEINLLSESRWVNTFNGNSRKTENVLYPDGSEFRGEMQRQGSNPDFEGNGIFIRADGYRQEGRFVDRRFAEGTIRRPDGTILAKGKWEGGQLSVGQLFDATGTTVTQNVDRPAEQAKAAAAAKDAREQALREAEAQRREVAAKAENDFRDSLNTLNVGQLFAKADELSSNGDSTKAREVLRTLISRFPDHPLAATAAQQMSSPAGQASANTTSGSTAGRRTSSGASCASALDQLQAKFHQLESNVANRSNERIMMQQLWAQQKFRSLAQTYPGCTASERDNVDRGIAQNQQVCRSGGYRGDCNLGYDAYGWSAAVDASMAEIMAGAGSASADVTNANASAQKCDSRLATQEREFEAVNRRPVPAGATPPLRRVMWMTSERIKLIRANCPSTAKYQQMVQELQTVYDQSDKACGQMMAGNVCPGPNPY